MNSDITHGLLYTVNKEFVRALKRMEESAVGVAQDPTKLDVKPKISNRHVVAEKKKRAKKKRRKKER